MSGFASRKVSQEGERERLVVVVVVAPSLRGSEFVWSALGKVGGKVRREGRNVRVGLGAARGRGRGGDDRKCAILNRKSREGGGVWVSHFTGLLFFF